MKVNDIYKDIIKNSRFAYFYGEFIYNENGEIFDAIIIDTNEAFAKKLGFEEDDITGKNMSQILFNSRLDWLKIINDGMKKNDPCILNYIENVNHLFEVKFNKVDDNGFYMTFVEVPRNNITKEYDDVVLPSILWYKDKNGRYVTNEKIQNDLLHRKNIQFDEILNAINDTIILLNRENIIYVNDSFERMFGVRNHELLKNPNILYDLFDNECKSKLGEYDFDKTYDIEIKVNTRNDEGKWVRYKDYHIDNKADDTEKITIISDITDKKESEMELERLRMEFFSNITHELKTPLNLIFSSLQLLELKSKQNINNERNDDKFIKIIRQNSLRLLKLVNNLIDSTKIDSEYLDLVYENGDIVYFVEQVFNSIEEYSTSKNIDIIFDTEMEEKIIAFDMDKMERIILNLLSNAIKFNKENGKIYLNINNKDEYIEICIKDTGIGIPEDKLNNVFDRFIQVNDRMTKISEGSGIGLSLTKSLVEMHGGSIDVISTLGEGTEFIVKIPNKLIDERVDEKINKSLNAEYNSFVKKFEIEFSDIY